MKITPVASAQTAVGQETPQGGMVERMRSMKMNTRATPGVMENSTPPPDPAQELPISDTSETQAVVEATQPLSPQFAELARRRRALQVKERELSDREKAFSSKAQEVPSIEIARLKSEPLRVLQEAGVTYDQLTEAILASQGNAEVTALKSEIEALKQGIDKKFVDRDTQAEQQVLAEMKRDATLIVSQDPSFELVKETRSIPDVMQLIEKTYRESGEVLDVKEALTLVEDYLFNEAKRLANVNKVRSQIIPETPPQLTQPRVQGMRTLTNKNTSSIPMSARDRALLAFRGELKK